MRKQEYYFTKLVLFVLLIAMPSMACAISGITADDNSLEATVSLSENTVNRILRNSVLEQDDDNLFVDVTSIDMQPGLIRIFGTYSQSDGTTVPGSADLSMSVQDGTLHAEITAVDIDGLDVDHARITHINDVMARAFAEEASANDQVEFVSVNISADEIEITVKVSSP